MEKRDLGNVYDIVKFAAAFLVIMIHTQPFENYYLLDKLSGVITRFAVPIFFTMTGYFIFDKNFTDQRLLRYLMHMVWFYLYMDIYYILTGNRGFYSKRNCSG